MEYTRAFVLMIPLSYEPFGELEDGIECIDIKGIAQKCNDICLQQIPILYVFPWFIDSRPSKQVIGDSKGNHQHLYSHSIRLIHIGRVTVIIRICASDKHHVNQTVQSVKT